MSAPKLISPMLDNFAMGDPICDHNGVRCCPAMDNIENNKYLVKIISIPSSATQLDALLLSGAYSSAEDAMSYFKTLADDIIEEANVLQKLSQLEGFLAFDDHQLVPMDSEPGYDVYLPISNDAVAGTISVLLQLSLPIKEIHSSTFSSSTPTKSVVLPALKKPPVVDNLVTWNLFFVNAV